MRRLVGDVSARASGLHFPRETRRTPAFRKPARSELLGICFMRKISGHPGLRPWPWAIQEKANQSRLPVGDADLVAAGYVLHLLRPRRSPVFYPLQV